MQQTRLDSARIKAARQVIDAPEFGCAGEHQARNGEPGPQLQGPRHVVTILCGSNVDMDAYHRWVGAAPPAQRMSGRSPATTRPSWPRQRQAPAAAAAKCLVVMVTVGRKQSRYVLAVVPGNARVDLQAVRALLGGTYVAFAGQGARPRSRREA